MTDVNVLKTAAAACGGTLVSVHIPPIPTGKNGGCGSRTYVEGTNGGTMPCGSLLTRFGKTEPYYCGHCSQERRKPKYFVIIDFEKVKPLFNCHDFDQASDMAESVWPNNHTWIATVNSLKNFRKILNALDLGDMR